MEGGTLNLFAPAIGANKRFVIPTLSEFDGITVFLAIKDGFDFPVATVANNDRANFDVVGDGVNGTNSSSVHTLS
jgi:hypothetical protein